MTEFSFIALCYRSYEICVHVHIATGNDTACLDVEITTEADVPELIAPHSVENFNPLDTLVLEAMACLYNQYMVVGWFAVERDGE